MGAIIPILIRLGWPNDPELVIEIMKNDLYEWVQTALYGPWYKRKLVQIWLYLIQIWHKIMTTSKKFNLLSKNCTLVISTLVMGPKTIILLILISVGFAVYRYERNASRIRNEKRSDSKKF
ncbi:unnamed protein product [Rotaria socialis]|uniref:Uncharacterized protein n=1 Tax=Rotaria socialis TaxID=392032 RepID=A0A821SZ36_9BILA|nr:unnamed protein product [Rotaria socialis]CAF4863822.1 unnamed protein product [Rotaria socialis]